MDMTEKNIKDLLATYGAEPRRWPDAVRGSAQRWLQDNPASSLVTSSTLEAQTLDALLNLNNQTVSDSSFLQARILKAAQKQSQNTPLKTSPPLKTNPPLKTSLGTPANDPQVFEYSDAKNRATAWGRSHLVSVKSLAATLLMTIGLGFGIGSSLGSISMANSEFSDAEYILSASLLNDYEQSDYTDLTTPNLVPNVVPNGGGL